MSQCDSPMRLTWVFLCGAGAIPINITTYNYVSYDVSQYFLVGSNSRNIDVGVDANYLESVASHDRTTGYGMIDTRSLLVLSDLKHVKLRHDYNNVLYCLVKYLKRMASIHRFTGPLNIDKDLASFVRSSRSTDEFLENVIRNRTDVKRILGSFLSLEKDILQDNDELIINQILENHQQHISNSSDFYYPLYNVTIPMSMNLVHLYHLKPLVDDTFTYQIFHRLNFDYPNLDTSINNTLQFLMNDTFFRSLLDLLSDLTKDIQIEYRPSGGLGDFRIRSETRGSMSSFDFSDVRFQLNVLVLVNLAFLGLKLMEFVNRGAFSFRSLVYMV